MKWNNPLYGNEGDGWFLAFRCYTKYVQLTFFKGGSTGNRFRPRDPSTRVRYFDIHEDDELDEDQLTSWIEQAASLPGEKL